MYRLLLAHLIQSIIIIVVPGTIATYSYFPVNIKGAHLMWMKCREKELSFPLSILQRFFLNWINKSENNAHYNNLVQSIVCSTHCLALFYYSPFHFSFVQKIE